MLSSSKVLKGLQVEDFRPRDIEVRKEFGKTAEAEYHPVVQAQLNWAMSESGRIVASAERQAAEILAQAGKEKEQLKAQAYQQGKQEGYQVGYREGYNAGQDVVQELIRKKTETVKQLQDSSRRLFAEAEESMLHLALEIAAKIINKQIMLDPEVVLEIAKNTLQEARAGETYLLLVNPDDLEIAIDFKDALLGHIPAGASLQVIPDAETGRGGCRVETELGCTDGTLESQMAEVAKLLGLNKF